MNKKKNNKRIDIDFLMYIMALPIILVVAVMPLIMKLNVLKTDLANYPWYSASSEVFDVFLYSRANLFIAIGVAMLVLCVMALAIGLYKLEDFKKRQFIPLGIYAIFAIISAIASQYKETVFNGCIEQYESIYVVLGYIVLTYYVYLFVVNYKNINIIISSIVIVTFIMSILGILQFIGKDFFETDLGKILIVPAQLEKYRAQLKFNFSNSTVNKVYMTLYNPNYVGVYSAMIIPILVMITMISKAIWMKVGMVIATTLLIVCDFASGSKTSLLAIIIGGIFYVIVIFLKNKKIDLKVVVGILAVVMFILGFDILSCGNYIHSIKKGFDTTLREYSLEDITIDKKSILLSYSDSELELNFEKELEIVLNKTQKLPLSCENGIYKIDKKGYKKISVQIKENDIYILVGKNQWHFVKEDEMIKYVTIYGKEDELKKAESIGFKGYEGIFTKRGYIWSRTLPLLKKHLIIGSGADTFVYEFPQDDYVMKTNVMSNNALVTRPHNMYLQTWVQEGMIAFISMMVFYLWYIVNTVRILIKTKKDVPSEIKRLVIISEGMLMANICYLVSMMANDSMIVTTPIHFVLIGCSIGINTLISQENV